MPSVSPPLRTNYILFSLFVVLQLRYGRSLSLAECWKFFVTVVLFFTTKLNPSLLTTKLNPSLLTIKLLLTIYKS